MNNTILALQEAIAFLENNHRNEKTLELRLLLREALADQPKHHIGWPRPSVMYPRSIADLADRKIPLGAYKRNRGLGLIADVLA